MLFYTIAVPQAYDSNEVTTRSAVQHVPTLTAAPTAATAIAAAAAIGRT